VEPDRVAAKSDVVRRFGFVIESQPEAKLLSVERDRPSDVPCAEDRKGSLNIAGS
jgi:hypothetical protein